VSGEPGACAAWGADRLRNAIEEVNQAQPGSVPAATQVTVSVSQDGLPQQACKPEGFRVTVSGDRGQVQGYDGAGAMYGCLGLARRVRELGRWPEALDDAEAPSLSLRGTCILLMKLGTYDYPITPAEFPFFYDKDLWIEYLDFLAESRFNYVAFWNGHPFDYFVKLDKYPEAQDGMAPGLLERNHDLLIWLGAEAEKRNIYLMFQFYNIHTSVYFQKAHRLPAWNPKPTRLLTGYTGYCIERFVSEFPGVGLYVCPGEALQLQYTADWINNVIFAAVKRTGKTPPIMVRAWAIDLEHARQLAGRYPRLYTERKFNVEMIAGTEVDPETKDWASITGDHVVNIHCMGNLEPFRWNPPSYIQKCLQSAADAGATGLHLYPRKAWRWPYGCDKDAPHELQWRRDRFWFEAWGRYAWNLQRNPDAERAHWLARLAELYGNPAAAEQLLQSFEAGADVLPALQRLVWLGDSNHTVIAAGATLDQIRKGPGIPFLPVPGMVRIPQYIEALKAGQPVQGMDPVAYIDGKVSEAERALQAARQGAQAATRNQAEAQRIATDAEAVWRITRFYVHKLKAGIAQALFEAHIGPAQNATRCTVPSESARRGAPCVEELRASVEEFRALTALTEKTYESISDVPAWHPANELPCPYHWRDVLPLYEKELAAAEKAVAEEVHHTTSNGR
jgi:hypothetical protein